jgi:CheY-like chemotaxis protein
MRDYVRRLLADRYAVDVAVDGEEAFAIIKSRRPDLVLTDVMMPRLDGLALLQFIRADPELRDLPVILLSARAGEEVEGRTAGADDYLTKPFSVALQDIETVLLRWDTPVLKGKKLTAFSPVRKDRK